MAQQTSAEDDLPGLTQAEAARRLAQTGPNAIRETVPPWWRAVLAKFWGPVPWLLEAAIVLQLGLGEAIEAGIIGGLLVFNAALAQFQEGRAGAALAALKARLAPTALVRRDGLWQRLPAAELVPGDAIRVPLGAIVPADARIATGAVLADASLLTGESVPSEAGPGDLLYAGALVRRGQALAEVTATGARTYFGRAAELVRLARAASTEQTAILAAVRALVVVNSLVGALTLILAHALGLPLLELWRLALTVLLATVPLALPATFTLSAALGAQRLGRHGVLLTRLAAAHEAAAMDLLCADKTGTLTQNALEVAAVAPVPGTTRERVLALAALASTSADQDPVDAAIRAAAAAPAAERVTRLDPFDPDTKLARALAVAADGSALEVVKGALSALAPLAPVPAAVREAADGLAADGQRVLAVAAGAPGALRIAGLVALGDPPREDASALVEALRETGVRTVMISGDAALTAAAVARRVGIAGGVCPPERLGEAPGEFGVYARVLPQDKFRLVAALQRTGHVVGMCGDGANDAPALRQAQIGIAVASATDVAKSAAALVLTAPGLAGVLLAVREGRTAFQRLLTYTLNMLVKKVEVVLLLPVGLWLTGSAVLTPLLMVLLLLTNDFLTMALTTDRATPAPRPSRWRMRRILFAAVLVGLCKLGFTVVVLLLGRHFGALDPVAVPTLAFVAIAYGNQAVLFTLRERGRLWHSRPSAWLLAAAALDIAIVTALALSGTLMAPLHAGVLAAVAGGAAAFALVLDRLKRPLLAALDV